MATGEGALYLLTMATLATAILAYYYCTHQVAPDEGPLFAWVRVRVKFRVRVRIRVRVKVRIRVRVVSMAPYTYYT